MNASPEKLRALLEPTVEELGYELVHLELTTQNNDQVLRIYIDAPGGIQVDDCATVSRQLSVVLDVEDPLKKEYFLEVSSPGIDRPLAKPAHFQQFVGEKVRVVMHGYVLGRRRFMGALIEANDRFAVIEIDGQEYELEYDGMESARLEPAF
ncbi:MAG: ribosome maturation factor RimP [Gammaproteobacteria bacterium]|nr:ribosome maturation factor RimP [Gammaproteobacteria bacterium]